MSERLPIHQLYQNALRTPQVRPGINVTANVKGPVTKGNLQTGAASFQNILQQRILLFSQHAETRLRQRGIVLQSEQIEHINNAIDKASSKGAKDSLILMNDLAFIVNIKNRTVVTAMDSQSLENHVFTKIDSAVIIP
jgi:flagellar operon protein